MAVKTFLQFFQYTDQSELKKMAQNEYENDFFENKEKTKEAFERAWINRNFEIDLYWKRATYFWALITSAFVGYFGLINSDKYLLIDRFNHSEVYFLICVGLILSVAWLLIQKGSKTWQYFWEAHIDLLEDKITGPLHKTIFSENRYYSVSKISEIASIAIITVWILLGAKYLIEQGLLDFNFKNKINWFVLLASIGVCMAIYSMLIGYGNSRFVNKKYEMYRRVIIRQESHT